MGSVSMTDLMKQKRLQSEKERTPRKTTSKLHEVFPVNAWKGRRVFIVGGGPSLKDFNFDKLKGEIVITINRAMEYVPSASMMVAQDAQVFGWYDNDRQSDDDTKKYFTNEVRQKWKDFKGLKVFINDGRFPYPEDLVVLDQIEDANPNWTAESFIGGIPRTSNSGLAALMLACSAGAKEVFLLGFDCKGVDGETANFHGGYQHRHEEKVYQDFINGFNKWAPVLKKRSKIVNLNPDSGIDCFEKSTFEIEVKPVKRPVIISFFTPEYESDMQRLNRSVTRYGFVTDFVKLKEKLDGSWLRTIYWRAEFILEMLQKHKQDVVWTDADSEFCQYPELFENFKGMFGAHWHKWNDDRGKELLGGTMYFKYCKETVAFVKSWIALNKQIPNAKLSQHVLAQAWSKWEFKDKSVELPGVYCQIFDSMAGEGEPVVHHYQSSRQHRE